MALKHRATLHEVTVKRWVIGVLLLLSSSRVFGPQYDILIRSGRVVDGTGNPWVYADVGVTRDRITLVGRAPADVTAKRVIDAKGLIVAPGFIDIRRHRIRLGEWRSFAGALQGYGPLGGRPLRGPGYTADSPSKP